MTQPKLKVKKGDNVVVIAGDDKGMRGGITRVLPEKNRVYVEGVNLVKRHQKQTPQNEGGIISKEASIHVSNVALEDPKEGNATRVGFKFNDEGRKVRFAKRSGETIDE